ncbi:MAG: hypothetical protein V1720_06165 [bacterium]
MSYIFISCESNREETLLVDIIVYSRGLFVLTASHELKYQPEIIVKVDSNRIKTISHDSWEYYTTKNLKKKDIELLNQLIVKINHEYQSYNNFSNNYNILDTVSHYLILESKNNKRMFYFGNPINSNKNVLSVFNIIEKKVQNQNLPHEKNSHKINAEMESVIKYFDTILPPPIIQAEEEVTDEFNSLRVGD